MTIRSVKFPLRTALVTLVVAVAGCSSAGSKASDSSKIPAATGTQPGGPQVALILRDIDMLAKHAGLAPARARALVNAGYVYASFPEYNDEQKFIISGSSYGAKANVFASPDLIKYTAGSDFDGAYKNVAIVDLAQADGSAPYKNLGLNGVNHCVYLMHTAATSTWTAVVTVVSGVGNCDVIPPANTSPTIPVYEESVSNTADDYPPVARFMEGTSGQTYIGLRCGNRWCVIGASAGTQLQISIYTANGKKKARGWHDQQHLAVGNPLQPSSLFATVVADDNLERTKDTYIGKWYPVATVVIPQSATVPPSYARKFGLSVGVNQISMTLVDYTEGIVKIVNRQNPGGVYRHVTRTDHSIYNVKVPGTVRWGWTDYDEEIWLSCDTGCCVVEAGS